MKPLSMVDLKGQYEKIKPEVDIAIQNVIDTTRFIKGPDVSQFQNSLADYLGSKHVVACGNGTDALQIALMALGLKPGDEVLTTNFTFIATVEVIALLGLKPILVDVDNDTFNINIDEISAAITSKTKAIIPVHLFGQCSNMEAIMKIAKQNNLFVIEDNAQAIGADYLFNDGTKKKAGTIGHIGCTSFFPSKNLGCYGDGGALFTDDDVIAEQIASIVNHGMKVRYYHDRIGVNSRLDTIQAAVLNVKLKYLDDYCAARYNAAMYYNQSFENVEEIEVPVVSNYTNHVFHQYTLKINGGNRDALKSFLDERNIPAMIYYPVPLHKQKAFKGLSDSAREYPNTDSLCASVLSLPMHTELSHEQQDIVINGILDFFN